MLLHVRVRARLHLMLARTLATSRTSLLERELLLVQMLRDVAMCLQRVWILDEVQKVGEVLPRLRYGIHCAMCYPV